jgi:hypothetical protein
MTVSSGPFHGPIPFLNIQDVTVDGMDSRVVTVLLSSELVSFTSQIVKFGNFVWFTDDPIKAAEMCHDHQKLKQLIRTAGPKNKFMFNSPQSEFIRGDTVDLQLGQYVNSRDIVRTFGGKEGGLSFGLANSPSLYIVATAFRQHNNLITIGNVVRETILEQNKTPLTAELYSLLETVPSYGLSGSVWPGAVHENEASILGGEHIHPHVNSSDWTTHQNDSDVGDNKHRSSGRYVPHSHPAATGIGPSSPVGDTSSLVLMAGNKHVQRAHPKLSSQTILNTKVIDNRVLTLGSNVSPTFYIEETDNPYLSPVQLSRNSQSIINGMFSFNISKFIEDNTKLKGVIKNTESLLTTVRLEDVIIYQKPSGPAPKGNQLTPVGKVSCGIGQASRFKKVASWGDGLEVLNTDNNGNRILDITFMDPTSAGMSSGHVEYRVEILLSDRSKEVIERLVSIMQANIKECEDLLVTLLFRPPGSQNTGPGPYGSLIEKYLTTLEFLFGSDVFSPWTRTYWSENLLAMAYSYNDDGQAHREYRSRHSKIIEMVNTFITKLNNLIKSAPMSTVQATNFHSKIYNSKKDNTLRLVKIFDDKLQIQGSNNVGLGYIDNNVASETVTPNMPFETFSGRTMDEIQKFNISNPDAMNINTYGYMSPSYVGLGNNSVSTTSMQVDISQMLPLINSSQSPNPGFDPEPTKPNPISKLEILASSGVSITALKVGLRKLVNVPEVVEGNEVSSHNIFGGDSTFLHASTGVSSFSGSTEPETLVSNQQQQHINASAPLVQNLVDETVTGFQPQTQLNNASMLQGSLMLNSVTQNPGIIAASSPVSAFASFGLTAQVQYLAPYNESTGVNQQNWTILDQNAFNQAQQSNSSMICRLTPVANTVAMNQNIQMDPMASLFVLGNDRAIERDVSTIKDIIDDLAASDMTQQKIDQIEALGRDTIYAKVIPEVAYRWHSVVPGQGLSGGQATAQGPVAQTGQSGGPTYATQQSYGTPVPGTNIQPQGTSNYGPPAAGSTPGSNVAQNIQVSSGPPTQVPNAPQQQFQSNSQMLRVDRLLTQGHMF